MGKCIDCDAPITSRANRCRSCVAIVNGPGGWPDDEAERDRLRARYREGALRRQAHVPAQRERAASMVQQGMTALEIAEVLGVTRRTVYYYLKALDVPPSPVVD